MRSTVTAIIAIMAANSAMAQFSCPATFRLIGVSDDGTVMGSYGLLQASPVTSNVVFAANSPAQAALFSLTENGQLVSSTGLIANIEKGFIADYIFFDSAATIAAEDLQPLTCDITSGQLSCADGQISTLQICDGFLSVGLGIQRACTGLTIVLEGETFRPCPSTMATLSVGSSTIMSSVAGVPTSTAAGTTTEAPIGLPTSNSTTSLATSVVSTTETLTVTSANHTKVITTAYPLYTTICPPGAVPTGTNHAFGGNSSVPAYGTPSALPAYGPHAAIYAAGSLCPQSLIPGNHTVGHSNNTSYSPRPFNPYSRPGTNAPPSYTEPSGPERSSIYGPGPKTPVQWNGAAALTFGWTGIFAAVMVLLI